MRDKLTITTSKMRWVIKVGDRIDVQIDGFIHKQVKVKSIPSKGEYPSLLVRLPQGDVKIRTENIIGLVFK